MLYGLFTEYFLGYFTLGLIVILGACILYLSWRSKQVQALGLLGIACYFASWGLSRLWTLSPSTEEGYALALRLWSLGLLVIIFMYVSVIFWMIERGRKKNGTQLVTIMIWAVLWLAEGFAIIEYILCKVITEQIPEKYLGAQWGVEVSRFACGRAFGDYWHAALPTITTAALVYILWAHWRSRRA